MNLNARVVIPDIDLDRAGWLAARRDCMTSSKIATVAGLNAYCSPLEAWARDTGKSAEENFDTSPNKELMQFGSYVEPFVLSLAAARIGAEVQQCRSFFRSNRHEVAGTSPDGFAIMSGRPPEVVEAKSATGRSLRMWEGGAPEHYQIQLQWHLGTLGLQTGWLVALLGGDPRNTALYRYDADPEIFGSLLEIADYYMKCVREDTPPETIQARDNTLVNDLYKKIKGEEIRFDAGDIVAEQIDQLLEVKAALKTLNAEVEEKDTLRKELEARLKIRMGSAQLGYCRGTELKVVDIHVKEKTVKAYDFTRLYLKQTEGE